MNWNREQSVATVPSVSEATVKELDVVALARAAVDVFFACDVSRTTLSLWYVGEDQIAHAG